MLIDDDPEESDVDEDEVFALKGLPSDDSDEEVDDDDDVEEDEETRARSRTGGRDRRKEVLGRRKVEKEVYKKGIERKKMRGAGGAQWSR